MPLVPPPAPAVADGLAAVPDRTGLRVPPRAWPVRLSPIAFGGDYTPEQWPDAVRREDVALMREAGVTAVTVGVFAWAMLEPAEGRYTFGWLDTVLDRICRQGRGRYLLDRVVIDQVGAAGVGPISNHPRPLQHRVQQHIAPGGDVLGLGVFDLVVADAVLAGDEDHAAGRQAGHVDGVVAGT